MLALAPLFPIEVIMSLLKLRKLKENKWYIPRYTNPFTENSFANNQYSPVHKKIRDCTELNYYTYIYPDVLNGSPNSTAVNTMSKLGLTLDIVIGLDKFGFENSTANRRVRGLH